MPLASDLEHLPDRAIKFTDSFDALSDADFDQSNLQSRGAESHESVRGVD